MNNEIFNLIPDSEYTIISKSFSELSNEEKLRFLEYLTAEEYELIRKNILMIRSVFNQEEKIILPDKEIPNKLLSVINKHEKIGKRHFYGSFIQLLNIKIPVYQSAAVLIVGIILFLIFKSFDSGYQLSPSKIDTVYIERNDNIQRNNGHNFNTNKRTVKINGKINKSLIKNNAVSKERDKADEENIFLKQNLNILKNNITLVQNTKTGRSLENEKEIYRILVTAQ